MKDILDKSIDMILQPTHWKPNHMKKIKNPIESNEINIYPQNNILKLTPESDLLNLATQFSEKYKKLSCGL